MEAFYFGPSTSSLLGVYYPARPSVDKFEGLVLCYPFGQEYMRSHRSYRLLSESLAKKGYHVLRFDYRGTGDSAEDLQSVTPADWLEDIELAVQELKDVAGITKVGLLGLRLGGLLAASVASKRTDISQLILWDTLTDGQSYIDEIAQSIEAIDGVDDPMSTSNFIDADKVIHFNGFAMSVTFQRELRQLNLSADNMPPVKKLFKVVSHENENFSRLNEGWSKSPGYHYQLAPAPHDWNYVDWVGGIMLPQPVLMAITEWV